MIIIVESIMCVPAIRDNRYYLLTRYITYLKVPYQPLLYFTFSGRGPVISTTRKTRGEKARYQVIIGNVMYDDTRLPWNNILLIRRYLLYSRYSLFFDDMDATWHLGI